MTISSTTLATPSSIATIKNNEVKKKTFSWNNIGIGAAIQIFEVSTLGQPFEVIKTHMAGINKIKISLSVLFCFKSQ